LRAERNTTGDFNYELSHDTLIAPIHEAAEKRRQKEEEERAEAERQEELRIAKEKQNRQRKIIAGVIFAAFIAIALAIFGIVMWQRAEEQTKIAEQKTEQAQKQKARSDSLFIKAQKQKARSDSLFIKANARKREAQREKAAADTARKQAQQSEQYARELLQKSNELLKSFLPAEVENVYQHFKAQGDKQFAIGEYDEALKHYNMAKSAPDLPPGSRITQKINLAQSCQRRQAQALTLIKQEKYQQAEQSILSVLEDNPQSRNDLVIASAIHPLHAMRLVQGGSFRMGSEEGEEEEKPIHKVTLSSFEMGRYEVTNLQYAVFLNRYGSDEVKSGDYAGQDMIEEDDWGIYKNPETGLWEAQEGYAYHPVIMVSWYGAREYARYYGLRLPTEAQWEYAARGGVQARETRYAGSDSLDKVAWYDKTSKLTSTFPVGLLKPNELGIYDMSGNVYEWCMDWYNEAYYEKSPEQNPVNLTESRGCVHRGGSWNGSAAHCRVANRDYWDISWGLSSLGFRVCAVRSSP